MMGLASKAVPCPPWRGSLWLRCGAVGSLLSVSELCRRHCETCLRRCSLSPEIQAIKALERGHLMWDQQGSADITVLLSNDMDEKLYDEAVAWCQRMITSNDLMLYRVHEFHHSLLEASKRFRLPRESLESLFRHVHLRHFKKAHYQLVSLTPSILKGYMDNPYMTIIDVARKFHLPPSVLARLIIENVTEFSLPPPKNQAQVNHKIEMDDEPDLADSSSFILNDSMEMEGGSDSMPHVNSAKTNPATSNANTPSSSFDNSTTSSIVSSTKKSSYQKKAIRNALLDPLTILGDTAVIRPMYQSVWTMSFDPSYAIQKPDPFTGLLPKPHNQNHNKLALDVWEAIEQDPMYGPRHDRISTIVGLEYELALEEHLRSMNIPFETERDLRERGTAKTPDILLRCPVAIQIPRRRIQNTKEKDSRPTTSSSTLMDTNVGLQDKSQNQSSLSTSQQQEDDLEWQVIQWVDSKAYFGDEYTHKTLVLQQAESYVHRFGPGLILYWFGHAPLHRLDHGSGDIFITGWTFPHTCLLPTGIVVQLGYPFIDT